MKDKNKLVYLLLIVVAFVVNAAGINVKFFTDDQGLYASIAKNLVLKNNFLQLFTYNQDWLDKPHFPFWMVMISFKLFGISVWAYRLPALLFFGLSLVYTYLFARKYYTWEIAAIAVLILATAQYTLMGNTDVRAEPYLMALVMGGIYHISNLETRFSFTDLLLAALLTACAIMTKGIFVIVAIYGGLLGQLIFRKKLSGIFNFKWIALLLLTTMFTLPEIYALYVQFDLHPEKIVFGHQHVSGIKWFLWDSQFGRFINNGPISHAASGDVFFYLHTLLWAFAPWCLVFYYAVGSRIKSIFQKQSLPEYYALSGGLLLLLLFSLSRFQLPFYTNTVFPLFAVITAPFCHYQLSKFGAIVKSVSLWLYTAVFILGIMVINFFLAPADSLFFQLDCIGFALLAYAIVSQNTNSKNTVLVTAIAALFANFYLNTVIYPEMAAYNGQIAAAEYVNNSRFDQYPVYSLKQQNNVFQFECKRSVDYIPLEHFGSLPPNGNAIFYATQTSVDYLNKNQVSFKVLSSFQNYPQERMLPAFLNKATRETVLDKVYLITK